MAWIDCNLQLNWLVLEEVRDSGEWKRLPKQRHETTGIFQDNSLFHFLSVLCMVPLTAV